MWSMAISPYHRDLFVAFLLNIIVCAFKKCSINLNAVRFREKGEAMARELGGSVEFSSFDMDDASALRTAIDGLDFRSTWTLHHDHFKVLL